MQVDTLDELEESLLVLSDFGWRCIILCLALEYCQFLVDQRHLQELLVINTFLHFRLCKHLIEDLLIHFRDALLGTHFLLLQLLELALERLL